VTQGGSPCAVVGRVRCRRRTGRLVAAHGLDGVGEHGRSSRARAARCWPRCLGRIDVWWATSSPPDDPSSVLTDRRPCCRPRRSWQARRVVRAPSDVLTGTHLGHAPSRAARAPIQRARARLRKLHADVAGLAPDGMAVRRRGSSEQARFARLASRPNASVRSTSRSLLAPQAGHVARGGPGPAGSHAPLPSTQRVPARARGFFRFVVSAAPKVSECGDVDSGTCRDGIND